MLNQMKKLRLNQETLRLLTEHEPEGGLGFNTITNCVYSCEITCKPD